MRLLLIDGHSMAFRAFYALPAEKFTTSTGQSTNAVYGFTSMLVKLLVEEEPTHVAVAWDREEPTFRHEEYGQYKSGRDATPPELPGQVELLQELLGLMGVPSLSAPGFEADDVVATLAVQGQEAGGSVVIASGDRDTFQLVSDRCTVLYPGRTPADLARMTPQAVRDKYGVAPESYRDLAALVGEKSDNLPGVPGVGPKTAAKWIAGYGSVDGLVERAEELGGKAGQNLRDHLDDVLRNLRLNKLITDVPLEAGAGELALGAFDTSGVGALFDSLEFGAGLRDRLTTAFGERAPAGGQERREGAGIDADPRLPGAGEVAGWLEEVAGSGALLGLAVAGTWSGGTGEVDGLALSDAWGRSVYLDPAALDAGDEAAVAAWMQDPQRPKAAHDVKGPLRALSERGWAVAGLVSDTRLAAYLLTPGQRGYDLADLCRQYLGRELSEQPAEGQLSLDVGAEGGRARDLARRARATAELAVELESRLKDRGEAGLLSEVELPLAGVLARMERTGIAVDVDQLRELEGEFAAAVRHAEQEAHRAVGRAFNLGSPKQLQAVLFDELQLPKTKRIKTGYTTDADALAWLAVQRPDAELPPILLRHRDQTRLRTTVEGLIKTVGDDGRIHTTYNQAVAATGRLSSTDPNLQNIPVRTDAGRRIRAAFVTGPGYASLMTADYSQIELRIMAHLSQDASLVEAFTTGRDFHTEIAARVFGVPPQEVDAAARARIKGMNYGLAYGLSAYGLAQQLDITPEEARALMEDYFAEFGGVRDYLREVVERARKEGYTETMLGRRRYLPDLTSSNRQRREMAERMALNAPIQGSAADIIKVAMLRVDAALARSEARSRMLLQVHDELVLEVAEGEQEALAGLVVREMGEAHELSVPLAVSVGTGRDWQAAAH